ncbi:amphinase-1-like [Dendropsophus ebraccatus]|uniref:amphinase-1-like n=1 Tax=Dendropsophus ebraccatus TaxID=150705 RepID=UPI003830FD19
MPSTSSLLLLCGLLFILPNLTVSAAPRWEDFKKNQVTSSPVVVCSVAMQGRCQETQSFIHTIPRILENICRHFTGMKNIRSRKELRVSTCRRQRNTTCSYGEAEVRRGLICVTCRNRKPVHFVKMGDC